MKKRQLTAWMTAWILGLSAAGLGVGTAGTLSVRAAQAGDDSLAVYVDARNGLDENPGTFAEPVQTVERAKELAREKVEGMTDDITVYLREGIYELGDTVTLDAGDGGTNGHNVIWTAYGDEKAVISGGTRITGWALSDPEKNIWCAPAGGIQSRDFYVDGKSAVRARSGRLTILQASGAVLMVDPEGLPASFARPQDLEIMFGDKWRWHIKHIDVATLYENRGFYAMQVQAGSLKSIRVPGGFIDIDDRAGQYLENAYELLDEPGEWYLNRDEDQIYYMPEEGQDMDSAETVLGRLERLFVLNGSAEEPVENITFHGLTFNYTTWLYPDNPDGTNQTQASMVDDDHTVAPNLYVLSGQYLNNIHVTGNEFVHLGNGGVDFAEGTKNCEIAGNTFEDMGAGAVLLSRNNLTSRHPETSEAGLAALTENNRIADNYIADINRTWKGGVAISMIYTAGSVIEHNTIKDVPYTAIDLGYPWSEQEISDYDTFVLGNNVISCNYIENCMAVLEDGGAIYSRGRDDGTQIVGNYITGSGDNGIYVDDQSFGYTVTGNVVTDSFRNFLYKGDHDYIYDNYTTDGEAIDSDWRGEDRQRFDIAALLGLEYDYRFEDNDLWDEETVEAIRAEAGVREPEAS